MRYPVPAYWRCRVERIKDGDSLIAFVDVGRDGYERWDVRLKGVWAPESKDPGGRETRDFILGWITDHVDGSEWPYLLETFRTPKSDIDVETFGRYVSVLTDALGNSLNLAIQQFVQANGYGGGVGSPG